jgi:hypothetical protein
MLGQYLPQLRPAPVIALTATATPRVQDVLQIANPEQYQAFLLFSEANIDAGSAAIAWSQVSSKSPFATHPVL